MQCLFAAHLRNHLKRSCAELKVHFQFFHLYTLLSQNLLFFALYFNYSPTVHKKYFFGATLLVDFLINKKIASVLYNTLAIEYIWIFTCLSSSPLTFEFPLCQLMVRWVLSAAIPDRDWLSVSIACQSFISVLVSSDSCEKLRARRTPE